MSLLQKKLEFSLQLIKEQLISFQQEMEYLKLQGGYENEIENIKKEIPHFIFLKNRYESKLLV